MKLNTILIWLVMMVATVGRAYPPGPASQQQVNDGTQNYLYVTPATLRNRTGGSVSNATVVSLTGVTSNAQPGKMVFPDLAYFYFLNGAGASTVQFLPAYIGGQDLQHWYVAGCPTNAANGVYTVAYYTNTVGTVDGWAFTNINGYTAWLLNSANCLAAVDDSQITPPGIVMYNNLDQSHWLTNVLAALHNQKSTWPYLINNPWSQVLNGVSSGVIFTNMYAEFGTNFDQLSLGIQDSAIYGGYIRNEKALISSPTVAANVFYTNTMGNWYLDGEAYLQSTTSAGAELDLNVAEYTTMSYDNPLDAFTLVTNVYRIKQLGAETNTYPFLHPITPLAKYWWTTNNAAGACSYPTNTRIHN